MRLFINDNFIHIQDNRFIRLKRSCYLLPEEFFLTGKEVCPSGILGFLLIHPLHRIGSDFHHSHKRQCHETWFDLTQLIELENILNLSSKQPWKAVFCTVSNYHLQWCTPSILNFKSWSSSFSEILLINLTATYIKYTC